MIILAGAMCLLFAIAIAICLLLDRRRARNQSEPDYESIPDDEASSL
jgi:sec-independent protein translocase protein TatC